MSQHHGFGRQSTIDRNNFMVESDFDAVSHAELAHSIVERRNTVQAHEIAVGSDAVMKESVCVSTGIDAPLVNQYDAGCNTARVQTRDVMIDTCATMVDNASQSRPQVRDMGCDGIVMQMQSQASQMDIQVTKDVDVTCDLLIPSDDDEAGLEEVSCFKCNGTQMNKKGLPCRKCNGRGTLVSKELSAVAGIVRQEVQEYCYNSFKSMFTDYLGDKKAEQD